MRVGVRVRVRVSARTRVRARVRVRVGATSPYLAVLVGHGQRLGALAPPE